MLELLSSCGASKNLSSGNTHKHMIYRTLMQDTVQMSIFWCNNIEINTILINHFTIDSVYIQLGHE